MCCFTGIAEEVTNIRIFARLNHLGDQVISKFDNGNVVAKMRAA